MTTENARRKDAERPEVDLAAQTEMMVYPLGFTPDIKARLANVDFGEGDNMILGLLTEEEIAVVLARVSRNPSGFLEIAQTVTEEGAAQFHQRWVVSVEGYGHASVAEHAVVHMALENLSSLAGDELTDNRLGSYTEFSARFRGKQNVGYYTPENVRANPLLTREWHRVHSQLFDLNESLMARGLLYIQTREARQKHPERRADGPKGIKTVSDQVKNLMPASRLTSIGVTMNAREVEHAVRKMLSSPYPEVREVGSRFKEQSLQVAPTLVKYAGRNQYLVLTQEGINFLTQDQPDRGSYPEISEEGQLVKLVGYDAGAEDKFIAAALYSSSIDRTFERLLEEAKNMSSERRQEIFDVLLGNLGPHDAPIRMLEFAGDYQLEVPGMTYGDWREWKRHRMETCDSKDLSVEYGYMIPALAHELDESEDPQYHGTVDSIRRAMDEVSELYYQIKDVDPLAAQYCVTRFHYRPAIVKMNPREAFHLVSLRSGPTAHPFIRRLAWAFYDEIKKVHPLFAKHLGKRLFSEGRPGRDNNWTY